MLKGKRARNSDTESEKAKNKKHKISRSETPPRASLLGLPGEIRNRIYREVLCEETRIAVDDEKNPKLYLSENLVADITEPGLLRCCSKIRNEARPIFLKENEYEISLYNDAIEPHLQHWFWKDVVESQREISFNFLKWSGVRSWLKAYWDGAIDEALFLEVFKTEHETICCICVQALHMVEQLKSVRWEVVEEVLHSLSLALDEASSSKNDAVTSLFN